MSNIINDITTYIKSISSYSEVYIDTLQPVDESICVRAEPTAATEQRYMDGGRVGLFQIAIYCKSLDKETAINQLTIYVNALDLSAFQITDRTQVSCEVITDPHFISQLENGAVIYTASFKIDYFQGA